MSAIFGLLRLDGGEASRDELERMGKVLAHRGPDGRRTMVGGPAGLGQGLMRVTEEDWLEAQPLHDAEANATLVADLRIDNRETLAEALGIGEAALAETPDSALVMAAYKRWGETCAEHLIGDFAFAIWDAREGKLVLGRDHMGQRTLFHSLQPAVFVFATEIKALWAIPDVPRVLSEAEVGRRMLMYPEVPLGATQYEGISGLARAMVTTVRLDGSLRSHVYWRPAADPRHEGRDEAYYVGAYREVLGEAVSCRLRRNLKPAALLLSGGYDSAAIAGLAGPVLAPRGRKLITVSAALPQDYHGPLNDVRPWVEMCRRSMPHLDVRYHVRSGETFLDGIERHMAVNDGTASLSQHIRGALNRMAAEAGARVVMDGFGGDYTLNPRGHAGLARFLRTGQFRRFLSELPGHRRLRGLPVWRLTAGALRLLVPPALTRLLQWLSRKGAPPLAEHPLNQEFARALISSNALDPTRMRGHPHDRTRMRDEMLRILERQAKNPTSAGANAAAAHGMDLTLPFHDKRVVELGLAIPEDLYVKDGRIRHLACAALQDLYPPEFQTRVWRSNDGLDPEFDTVIDSMEAALLAEVDRLSAREGLARYVDFPRLRRILLDRRGDSSRAARRQTAFALRALLGARHVEWFTRANR